MMTNSTPLLEDMLLKLQHLSGLQEDDLSSIMEATSIVSTAISKLKADLLTGEFKSIEDEIHFFKKIKPQFDGRLIFYLILLRMHSCSPFTVIEDKQSAYLLELKKLQPFYEQHYAFWQYYSMEHTHMDNQYFLRKNPNDTQLLQEDHIHYDWQSNTLMSSTAARIHAYELFKIHTGTVLAGKTATNDYASKKTERTLKWTGSKANLIELIYALHEYGVFNNTRIDIKKITDYFSLVFQVHFANVYKTYEDIRLRKKGRTPFLDALKAALEKRIDRDDENAM